jgi:hypothetical protein
MTTTVEPTLTRTTDRSRIPAHPVLLAGAVSGVIAAVATTAVVLAAKAVDVPMMAAPQTASFGEEIPLGGFATATLMGAAIGTILALALARWARRPARTFVITTLALTVFSFSGVITTGYATTATRLVLALTHVVAAAIVIPALTRCLTTPEG